MTTVLVVDDSATMRRMIAAALRAIDDISVDQAASGLEAIERLALAPPDLVILDLNMPDVHGLEVLHFVRTHASLRELPVIVVTTRGDEASRTAAERAGATEYLTKPFTPEMLESVVRRQVSVEHLR